MNHAIIFDATRKSWFRFQHPIEIVTAWDVSDVVSSLHRIEELVNRNSLFAVGFISYEASPAFDSALPVRPSDSFPLLWFGLYRNAEVVALPSADTSLYSLGEWNPSVNREEYDNAIARIKSYIQAGDTYQVNFSFRLKSDVNGEPIELFHHLANAQPSSNGAFIETDVFAICSASPELFFLLDGEKIIARPMKGTARRGLTLIQDKKRSAALHLSEKNRAENLMIVDMMRNDIGRIARTGSVRVPSLFDVERYPTVWQMTSTIAGETNASVAEIVKALFPCASITGAPKARTMKIIAELESAPRKIYTGAIGFIAPNRKAQFNVAIRTVLVDKGEHVAEYGVGGGIVWSSTSEGEYEECMTKARVLAEIQPQFALFETLLWSKHDGFFLLDQHFARLKDSAEYFDFRCSVMEVQQVLSRAREHTSDDLRVKLILSRDGSLSIDTHPISLNTREEQARVRLAKHSLDSQNLFLYHKTTHRSMYDMARASVADCDDVILWNERGEVTESTIANIVVEIEGKLFTPPVDSGLLAGTFRNVLLQEGKIKERVITVEELTRCQRLYLINSLRKWREAILL